MVSTHCVALATQSSNVDVNSGSNMRACFCRRRASVTKKPASRTLIDSRSSPAVLGFAGHLDWLTSKQCHAVPEPRSSERRPRWIERYCAIGSRYR